MPVTVVTFQPRRPRTRPPPSSAPATGRPWRWPRTPTSTASPPCRPRSTTASTTTGCRRRSPSRARLRRDPAARGHRLGDHRPAARPAAAGRGDRRTGSAERRPAGDGRRDRVPARGVRPVRRGLEAARAAAGRAAGDAAEGMDRRGVRLPGPYGTGHPAPVHRPAPPAPGRRLLQGRRPPRRPAGPAVLPQRAPAGAGGVLQGAARRVRHRGLDHDARRRDARCCTSPRTRTGPGPSTASTSCTRRGRTPPGSPATSARR